MAEIILTVRNLVKTYAKEVKAVRGVSFDLFKGETLGIVGESGCGKSTLGKTIIRLLDPTSGTIRFNGEDLTHLSQKNLRPLRRQIQFVFQDPYSSLNPRMTIGEILAEPLIIHKKKKKKHEIQQRVLELLDLVGLRREVINRFPHEFSGGQRQRVGIARALSVEPELIIFDEPVSALDVSIQAQIINLLVDLQKKLNLTYLFIAHDLRVVEYISDRVAVMYRGQIVELATTLNLFKTPKHPYTKALLSAIPEIEPDQTKEKIILKGEIPSSYEVDKGCSFCSRCPSVMPRCYKEAPLLSPNSENHLVACHL